MKENNNKRSKWLHLRLTEEEYKSLQQTFEQTTETQLSVYARKVFLGKPVIKGYRNRSLDELIGEFIGLNKSLNGIANNYNQSVHKLHTFDHVPQVKSWLVREEMTGLQILSGIKEIRILLKKMTENDSRH